MKKLLAIFIIAGLSMSISAPAMAGDCFSDPVYERSMTGVTKIGSRVRDVACMEGSVVLTTINAGKTVNIIGETDGWYKVQLADGTIGWVGATLINVSGSSNDSNVDKVVKEVKSEATKTDESLGKKLAGYILLQVEQNGEAFYVNTDGTRIYMKDGVAAFEIMRSLGLGISEANFAKLKKGDASLKEKLKGKIILQVEKNGEAHYIDPKDKTVTYLKNGEAAYKIMRDKGLGIKDKELKKLKLKELSSLKKELQQQKKELSKEEYLKQKEELQKKKQLEISNVEKSQSSNGTIALSATKTDNGVNLSWSLSNMSSEKGFKVVWSNEANPVYPGNDYHYLSNEDARSDTISGLPSGAYHFRVCEYLGGKCGVYSNDIAIEL